jgi:hypothetical protein
MVTLVYKTEYKLWRCLKFLGFQVTHFSSSDNPETDSALQA